jgi:hypothetical protein
VLEAERALRLLGLDPEDRHSALRLTEYRRGLCLMRDLDGRVGEVQFDVVFPEVLAALDTTPRAAEADRGAAAGQDSTRRREESR